MIKNKRSIWILVFGILIIVLGFYLFSINFAEEDSVDLVYFYGEGCSFSAHLIGFLDEINYSSNSEGYECWHNQTNMELFGKVMGRYNRTMDGIPTIVINGKIFVGISPSTREEIKEEIEICKIEGCENPLGLE